MLGLLEDEVAEDEHIHLGPHEAAVGIFGRADDGFAADVERRIDEDAAAREATEFGDQVVVGAMDRPGARSGRVRSSPRG